MLPPCISLPVEEVMHKAIGRLRGKSEPRDDILDRLLEINANFRVYWVPAGAPMKDEHDKDYQRPAMWRVCEHRPSGNPLRQAAAYARLERMLRWPEDKQKKNPGLYYDAEESLDECFRVGEFSNDFFGSDTMFESLLETEKDLLPIRDNLREAQAFESEGEIVTEMGDNPVFNEQVREVAKDFYNRVKGNPVVGYGS